MRQVLAIFGPVPPGGTSTLPGLVLFALALLGFLSLPAQLAKMRSVKAQWGKIKFLVAVDSAFILGRLVMLVKR